MRSKIFLVLGLLLTALTLCACLMGTGAYRSLFAQIREESYLKTANRLDLSGKPLESIAVLRQFSQLDSLDLRSTGISAEQYETLKSWFPGCDIFWDIPFQDQFYPEDTRELRIARLTEEDIALLDYFPRLKRINAQGCTDYAALEQLRSLHPELEVSYGIAIGGKIYSRELTQLTVSADHWEELLRRIPYLKQLKSVTLTNCWGNMEAVRALRNAFPELDVTWRFSFRGLALNEFTETLDLTGIPMTKEEAEKLLAHLPNLTYVDMTDCGISNEDMERINLGHPDVKVVWTVKLGRWFRLRTDVTWFMPVKDDFYPRGDDLVNLKYCHDIIALDIGHMDISSCEFVAYMPNLKYLLMADTPISDLTPLTGLTELVYLELFLTRVTDCTPLLTLTSLEDLNLCYTIGDPVTISQMTWLKNVWWTNCRGQYLLMQNLPDTNLVFNSPSSTGNGWRELPNYYAQRDIFGMYYMTG